MRMENYELPPQLNANLFIALEMLKMFAIQIHDDDSDYSLNGLAVKNEISKSLIYGCHNSSRHEFNR